MGLDKPKFVWFLALAIPMRKAARRENMSIAESVVVAVFLLDSLHLTDVTSQNTQAGLMSIGTGCAILFVTDIRLECTSNVQPYP